MSDPIMIRPCDECGGSGVSPYCEPDDCENYPDPCPRCEGMPKLKCQRSYHNEPGWMPSSEDVCQGWFFPDPDTVMKWCDEHGAPKAGHGQTCLEWQRDILILQATGMAAVWRERKLKSDCRLGWVARPTPLEVVEE